MLTTLKELAGALWQGIRSALLLRPRADALDVGLPACVALCAVELIGTAGLDLAQGGSLANFEVDGVTRGIAFFGVLLAGLVWLPFRAAGALPRRLFVGVLAVSVVISAVVLPLRLALISPALSSDVPVSANMVWIELITLWLPAAAMLWTLVAVLRLGFGLADRFSLLAGLGLAATTTVAAFALPPAQMFPGDETERAEFSVVQAVADKLKPAKAEPKSKAPPRPRIDVEATMMRQHEMLATALAPLKPPRQDQPELYYVGMAPFAEQDVFKRESTAVKALFDNRFGTTGRSLALVNHRDTVDTLPLASLSNLDRALKHIGGLMRPETDVLFLFITSHGTDGLVSVLFPRFALNEITPDRLVKALDKAGIRNRVLVISACHSGSFIPALANDNTLILTAARADRTSFGCSNENEWTYFGDAYFNHALRQGTSFIDAFDVARNLISGWEAKQKFTPSEPQISIGANIRATLAKLVVPPAVPTESDMPTTAGARPNQ
jgi:hypothetical protein